jgi:hypothetical protein
MAIGKFRYNWYMNSKNSSDDSDNSFRPPFQTDWLESEGYTKEQIDQMKKEYGGLTRKDWDFEATAKMALKLWKKASLAFSYVHNTRLSNIDDAPKPVVFDENGKPHRYISGAYGYNRDRFFLELTQRF